MSDPLREQIKQHEGFSRFPYVDTVGKVTIGYGCNLTDCGISEATADQMLDEDLDDAVSDCASFPWFARLDAVMEIGTASPSDRAAEAVLDAMSGNKTPLHHKNSCVGLRRGLPGHSDQRI